MERKWLTPPKRYSISEAFPGSEEGRESWEKQSSSGNSGDHCLYQTLGFHLSHTHIHANIRQRAPFTQVPRKHLETFRKQG